MKNQHPQISLIELKPLTINGFTCYDNKIILTLALFPIIWTQRIKFSKQ